MSFRKLTRNDAGEDVALRTREDWDEWVSATKLRGYLPGNALGDRLNLYGEAQRSQRDDALTDDAEQLDLVRVGSSGLDTQDLDKAKGTLAVLAGGAKSFTRGSCGSRPLHLRRPGPAVP